MDTIVPGKDYMKSRYNYLKNRSDAQILEDQKTLRPNGLKKCNKCQETMPLSMFFSVRANKDGLDYRCKKHSSWNKVKSNRKARSPEMLAEILLNRYPDGLKECWKCKKLVPAVEYHKSITQTDGLQAECTPCMYIRNNNRYNRHIEEYWSLNGIPEECYLCGGPYEHADHVVPESLEGPDTPENILPMCAHHNCSKNDTPLEDWLRRDHPDLAQITLAKVLSYGVNPYVL